jgi:hypothetical protein
VLELWQHSIPVLDKSLATLFCFVLAIHISMAG